MLIKEIQSAFQECETLGWDTYSEDLSISKGALFHISKYVNTHSRILELGGGKSSLMWYALQRRGKFAGKVTTVVHDSKQGYELKMKMLDAPNMEVIYDPMAQISDEAYEQIFTKEGAREIWKERCVTVPHYMTRNFSIKNAFYQKLPNLPFPPLSIDVLILDGPHGNGRSLAFPLLKDAVKDDAIVFIDDYDHYPFMDALKRVYYFEPIYKEVLGEHRWSLVRLKGRRLQ